jgi:hypothetical protein
MVSCCQLFPFMNKIEGFVSDCIVPYDVFLLFYYLCLGKEPELALPTATVTNGSTKESPGLCSLNLSTEHAHDQQRLGVYSEGLVRTIAAKNSAVHGD